MVPGNITTVVEQRSYLTRLDVVTPEAGDGVGHELAPPVVQVLRISKPRPNNTAANSATAK